MMLIAVWLTVYYRDAQGWHIYRKEKWRFRIQKQIVILMEEVEMHRISSTCSSVRFWENEFSIHSMGDCLSYSQQSRRLFIVIRLPAFVSRANLNWCRSFSHSGIRWSCGRKQTAPPQIYICDANNLECPAGNGNFFRRPQQTGVARQLWSKSG